MIYSVKIQENAERIVKNLSPLVGCKLTEKRWSPRASRVICKPLDIAYALCINTDKDKIQVGRLKYSFDNRVSIRASNISNLALDYSPIALSPTYALQAQESRHNVLDTKELLYIQSLSPNYNDSAIVDIFEENKSLRLCPYYKHVMLVLLECFTLRWTLYEYAYEGLPLKQVNVSDDYINRIVKNIEYVKYRLEEWDSQETAYLSHHLSTLLMNVLAVKKDVTKYFLEVNY